MKNKKKKVIIVLLVVIFIILLLVTAISGISDFIARKPKDNERNNNVDFTIVENKAEKLLCKNYLQNIEVGNIELYDIDKEHYIVISLTNTTDINQIDIPLKLNIINKAGDVIFQTGTVKKILPKGNLDNVYFKVTKEVKTMIENGNEIDFIELSKEK